MARAYGLDLRRRVIEAIDSGMSARKAAGRCAVGVATAISWHRRWREQGSLEPGRQGKPSRSRLEPHEDFIVALMQEQPAAKIQPIGCLLYTSPSPRDKRQSRMPSSA